MFICKFLRVLAVTMQMDWSKSSSFIADKMSDRVTLNRQDQISVFFEKHTNLT